MNCDPFEDSFDNFCPICNTDFENCICNKIEEIKNKKEIKRIKKELESFDEF